jgi:hypothetical protein
MSSSVLAVSGEWQVTCDDLQWILRRRKVVRGEGKWIPVSFVRSTKDILARCMREKGCPPEDGQRLLQAVGERFLPLEVPMARAATENALQPAVKGSLEAAVERGAA